MGIHDFLKGFEGKLDEKYKESSPLAKLVQRYSPIVLAAGMAIAAITAPILGTFYYSAKRSYEQQAKQEARQESLRFKEGYLQELSEQKKTLDAGQEQLNKEREAAYQKERDLDFRKMELDSAARIAEFDKKYLKIKEDIIQAKKELVNKQLDKRESSLDAKEEALQAAAAKAYRNYFEFMWENAKK